MLFVKEGTRYKCKRQGILTKREAIAYSITLKANPRRQVTSLSINGALDVIRKKRRASNPHKTKFAAERVEG